jgi:precorrin-2 dehydrogenase/sirohydrochlorin ferrochelatase
MNAFPAYFPLTGRKVVIVGSGETADGKARLFDGSPAELVRIAEGPEAFAAETYAGAALVFIATSSEASDMRAAAAVRAAHVPVNVVDRPALCDFYTPAVVDRADVVVAIGTNGAAPVLSGVLREAIEAAVPEGVEHLAALLGRVRAEVRAAFPDFEARRVFLRAQLSGPAAEAALAGDMARAEALLRSALTRSSSEPKGER